MKINWKIAKLILVSISFVYLIVYFAITDLTLTSKIFYVVLLTALSFCVLLDNFNRITEDDICKDCPLNKDCLNGACLLVHVHEYLKKIESNKKETKQEAE